MTISVGLLGSGNEGAGLTANHSSPQSRHPNISCFRQIEVAVAGLDPLLAASN